jgi:hypothetical protein
MAWTSDGYALAVGYERGWAVWSMGGRLGGWGMADLPDDPNGEPTSVSSESFMHGVSSLVSVSTLFSAEQQFWAPGNLELFMLSPSMRGNNSDLHVLPFSKSATTGQHSPVSILCGKGSHQARLTRMSVQDNTRYAFLQMDDRVMVYRGADQPDMSVINPESDVWQNIKVGSILLYLPLLRR